MSLFNQTGIKYHIVNLIAAGKERVFTHLFLTGNEINNLGVPIGANRKTVGGIDAILEKEPSFLFCINRMNWPFLEYSAIESVNNSTKLFFLQ